MKRKLKGCLTALAVLLFVSGWIGFFIYLGYCYNPKNVLPMYGVGDILVDGQGLIYVGSSDAPRVQVFDNKGNYLYSHCVSTLGGITFFISEDGVAYLYSYREDTAYTFKGETLLAQTAFTDKQWDSLYKEYGNTFNDWSGNTYQVKGNKVYFKTSGESTPTKIKFDVPLLPFNTFLCGGISFVGVILFLFLHSDYIAKTFPQKIDPYTTAL